MQRYCGIFHYEDTREPAVDGSSRIGSKHYHLLNAANYEGIEPITEGRFNHGGDGIFNSEDSAVNGTMNIGSTNYHILNHNGEEILSGSWFDQFITPGIFHQEDDLTNSIQRRTGSLYYHQDDLERGYPGIFVLTIGFQFSVYSTSRGSSGLFVSYSRFFMKTLGLCKQVLRTVVN